jgi:hypothetical protein
MPPISEPAPLVREIVLTKPRRFSVTLIYRRMRIWLLALGICRNVLECDDRKSQFAVPPALVFTTSVMERTHRLFRWRLSSLCFW